MTTRGPTQQELDALHDAAVSLNLSERDYWQQLQSDKTELQAQTKRGWFRQETYTITQRHLDNQYFDLAMGSRLGGAPLDLFVNGVPKIKNTDFITVEGGLYPLRIKILPDVGGSLNNKFVLVTNAVFGEGVIFWFNVAGAGDANTVYNACNTSEAQGALGARLCEIPINTNDNALVVAQAFANAVKKKVPEFLECDTPAVPTVDTRHSTTNSTSICYLYLYPSYSLLGGNRYEFKDINPASQTVTNTGWEITNMPREKFTRISWPTSRINPCKFATRKIMCTLDGVTNKIILPKDFHFPDRTIPNGMTVTGTGIPAGTTVTSTSSGVLKPSQAITKTEQSCVLSGLTDVANIGYYSKFSGATSPGGTLGGSVTHVDGTSVYTNRFARSGSIGDTANGAGVGASVFSECALTLSQNTTVAGTYELTFSWDTLSIKLNDKIVVEYEADIFSLDSVTKTMVVNYGGAQPSGNSNDASWLTSVTSTIPLTYREGGDKFSKETLILVGGTPTPISSTFSPFLVDTYGLDAKIYALNLGSLMPNIQDDMGAPPTGAGSCTTFTPGVLGQSSEANDTRALIDFVEKLGRGKVFLSCHSAGGGAVLAAARLRPDLFKGIIACDPYIVSYTNQTDSFLHDYAVLPGAAFNTSTLNTNIANNNLNRLKAKAIWEAGDANPSDGFGNTGEYVSMPHTLRAAHAIRYFNFLWTAVPSTGTISQFQTAYYLSSDMRSLAYMRARMKGTAYPSMAVIQQNELPFLWVQGSLNLFAIDSGVGKAYLYGIQNSIAGLAGKVTVVTKTGGVHPVQYDVVPEIFEFMAAWK